MRPITAASPSAPIRAWIRAHDVINHLVLVVPGRQFVYGAPGLFVALIGFIIVQVSTSFITTATVKSGEQGPARQYTHLSQSSSYKTTTDLSSKREIKGNKRNKKTKKIGTPAKAKAIMVYIREKNNEMKSLVPNRLPLGGGDWRVNVESSSLCVCGPHHNLLFTFFPCLETPS